MKKRPYIKKIKTIAGYNVWYVSGYWIRRNLDRQFPNFAYKEICPYIPQNEFWIDKENGKKEARYWIDYFLAFKRELNKGTEYLQAVKIANKIEKKERDKSKFIKKLKKIKIKKRILKRLHKKQLFKNKTKSLKIWIVRGDLVRSIFYLDFNQGGHDLVYNFIPKNEIWLDDDVYKKERAPVLIHELHERKLMKKGWKYDSVGQKIMSKKESKSAHFAAEEVEFWCRNHPKSVKRVLLREIGDNEKLSK